MSSLIHEDGTFSLPFKPVQRCDQERHVNKEQLAAATESDEESGFLPDASDLKVETPAESENDYQHNIPSPGRESTRQFDHHVSSSPVEEAEPHASSRPNTYKGPPSTWLDWTASERGVAASLDQLKAQDLAVHLYNAHHLKKRAKNPRLIDNEGQSATRQEWKPSRSWTAWPLEPDVVPRGNDSSEWAGEDLHRLDHSYDRYRAQRHELQDLLVAQFLKNSKRKNEGLRQHGGEPVPIDTELDPQSTNELDINNDPEPVTMLDDDVANDILLPTTCHIFTKLDQLLIGLHHARDSYAYKGSHHRSKQSKRKRRVSESRTRGSQSQMPSPSAPPQPETRCSSEKMRQSKIKRSRERSPSPTRESQRRVPRERLAQRDWGDVLGVASMAGWDSKIVRKAAYRCGTLFGEDMNFRKLEENGNDPIETSALTGALSSSDADSAHDKKMDQEDQRSPPSPGPIEKKEPAWKMLCSVEGCKRSSRGFMDYRAVRRHFKNVHSGLDVPAWPQSEESEDAARGKQRSSPPPGPPLIWKMYCPVDGCTRSSRGFMDYRAFKRHVQHSHPDVIVPDRSKIEEDDEDGDDSDNDETDGDMFGGVHVDGFLQPVEAVTWWTARRRIRAQNRNKSR